MMVNQTATATGITPFRIEVPAAALDDLYDRLTRTRWPSAAVGAAWERGVSLDYLHELADYWRTSFDWRRQEAKLNQFPQFTTTIDGQTIHFLHVQSPEPNALPLILVHGWPGSIVEFMEIIGPLSDPRAHGGDPAEACHVVVPSIPGFGYSSPLSGPGWDTTRIARAFAELTHRLGYDRYAAQGGDFGAFIAPELGRVDPDHVAGVHVNAATVGFIPFGPVDAATLTASEQTRLERLNHFLSEGNGYFQVQATRPQTIAYGLTDSPVGQLAWIVEKFKEWTHPATDLPERAVDRDQMLTNVSLYWFTGTAGSSANFYYENMHGGAWPSPSPVPTGVAVFAEDIAIRQFAEPNYNIVHWSEFERGGHFAAMEAPDLLVRDIRAFLRGLRGNR